MVEIKTSSLGCCVLGSIGRVHHDIMIPLIIIKIFCSFRIIWAATHWVVTQDGRITPQVKDYLFIYLMAVHLLRWLSSWLKGCPSIPLIHSRS